MHWSADQRTVVVAGSSITDCQAWPTWAHYVHRVFSWPDLIDVSAKGLGNEHILIRAVNQAKKSHDPFLLVQLTTIDKWDWYVDRSDLVNELSNQRHPLLHLSQDTTGGFWSTGSHFPLHKEYYRQNYYSHDYFVWRTLQLLQWFFGVCARNHWPYYVLFDSPIFAVTEAQLNQNQAGYDRVDSFLQCPLASTITDLWELDQIYLPGLIGYAVEHGLPWWCEKFKGHPGSLTHYCFAKDIVMLNLIGIKTTIVHGGGPKISAMMKKMGKFQKMMMRMGGGMPGLGTMGAVEEGVITYRWQIEVLPWPEDTMQEVTVQVFFPAQGREYDVRLTTLEGYES
jgi:hypothetical protein